MNKNLTSENILRTMLTFAIPYIISYFLQTLYGMADLFIVGQFNDVNGITSVSNGSQFLHMLTVIIVGLAMGVTVMIARYVGAKEDAKVSKTIGNTIVLFIGISLLLTIFLVLSVSSIIQIMSVPQSAISGTKDYLIICFLGIPFITAYNIISSIFRGLQDSKSPMYFIGIACIANILLDYLFIGTFHMGPKGAAFGTVLAQTLSVCVALFYISLKKMGIKLSKSDLKPSKKNMAEILKVGIPVSVQDGCIQVAFMIITIIANHRGLTDAAAVGVVEKFISAVFIIPSSMLATVSSLAAQNLGAKKVGRAQSVLRYATIISVVYGVIITCVVQGLAPYILRIFTSDSAVILSGSEYLKSYIFDCIFAGIHFSFTGYFAALQKSYIGFIHNMIAIIFIRIPGSYFASLYYPMTLFPMGMAAPLGSLLSVVICVGAYMYLKRKPYGRKTII